MTLDQAIAVRTLHLCGIPQIGWVLNEAIAVIKNTRTETPHKRYGEAITTGQVDTQAPAGCDLCPNRVREFLTKHGRPA